MPLLDDPQLWGLLEQPRHGWDSPTQNPGLKKWRKKVATGQYANEGIERIASAVQRAAMGDPQGGIDVVTEFGGLGGIVAGPMAKTANIAKLKEAQELLSKGANKDEILAKTGWFQGPDKKWRFEINDSQSALTLPYAGTDNAAASLRDEFMRAGKMQRVGDVLNHDELSAAYPDIPYIHTAPQFSEGMGGFDPEAQRLSLGSIGAGDARSVMLHELQHAIQRQEGLASGGSPSEFMDLSHLSKSARRDYGALMRQRNQALESGNIEYAAMLERQADEVIKLGAADKYNRLAGEAEARAVQARMSMTPEERLSRPFWADYDVPLEQQIIK